LSDTLKNLGKIIAKNFSIVNYFFKLYILLIKLPIAYLRKSIMIIKKGRNQTNF